MKWVVISIGGIFLLSLAVLGFARVNVHEGEKANLAAAGAASDVPLPSIPVTRPAGTPLATDSGPVTLEGTAIMDTSTGIPAIPYIEYSEPDGDTATKQLIFADARGCLAGAGDIPCVPGYPVRSAYPTLSTGQHIRVEGIIRENRFLVTSLAIE